MNLLTGNLKKIYYRYLAVTFGSAMITSIYSIVDMSMVGQYQGPNGTAALAVVAPIWNVIYSLGLLMGIGGSVIFSTLRGQNKKTENEYFTVSAIGSTVLAILTWVLFILFEKEILFFFGANENLLPLTQSYLQPIKYVIPCFLFNQMLAAFLRNDNHPTLATIGVLAGGLFNVVGDYVFVFTFDMGIYGAGLATAIGSLISLFVLLSHFISSKNTLHFVKPTNLIKQTKEIITTGFSTFFIDVAMGILTILFNRQIMKYLGTSALAVYGPIVNISTLVQCCAYSVGQATQPIISINFGAKQNSRIKQTLKYALYTVGFFSIFWTSICVLFPNLFIHLFMKPTVEILAIASNMIRIYSISFLLLPLNIFSTYYFQSLLQPKASFIVSISRGCIISGLLIMILPILSPNYLWFTMPLTEFIVSIYSIYAMKKYTKALTHRQYAY